MANCISCGRPLPVSLFGQKSDVCAECRRSAIDVAPTSAPYAGPMDAGYGAPPPAPRPPAQRRFLVTKTLVGLNAAVYVLMVLSGVSFLAPSTRQLLVWEANFGPLSLTTQPWRMFTSNYVHGGLLHIGLNMWCLWNLGFLAEIIFDRWTYLLVYTACGIGGSIASLAIHPQVVGVGASGAIFGLAGALISAIYLGHLPIPKQALKGTMRSLVTFAGYNLFFGAVVPGIDNSAHIGGLITGLIVGAMLAKQHFASPEQRVWWRRAVFLIAAFVLFSVYGWVRENAHYPAGTFQPNAPSDSQPPE
jgi:rhomboid protease GluP